jgi:hypothetical protein
MSSRTRAAAMVAVLLPLFVVVVEATGIPTPLRAAFGAVFVILALVAVARAAASRP